MNGAMVQTVKKHGLEAPNHSLLVDLLPLEKK
nr:hypothetical protein [Bacillus sp. 03113]